MSPLDDDAPVDVRWLGTVPYRQAFDLQKALVALRAEDRVQDQLLLLEHPPVITWHETGRGREHLLATEGPLRDRGVDVQTTDRGGDITYHGPGQLVGYPIVALRAAEQDLHGWLRALEQALIDTAATFGVRAERAPGLTGVWVGGDKLAAIGVKVSRWVTHHGFALNVCTDLSHFDLIVPCGIPGRGVTSLSLLLGRPVPVAEAALAVVPALARAIGRRPVVDPDPLPAALSLPHPEPPWKSA